MRARVVRGAGAVASALQCGPSPVGRPPGARRRQVEQLLALTLCGRQDYAVLGYQPERA